jgi:hypothetical protein
MANTDIPMIIGAFFSIHVRRLEGGSVGRTAVECCSFSVFKMISPFRSVAKATLFHDRRHSQRALFRACNRLGYRLCVGGRVTGLVAGVRRRRETPVCTRGSGALGESTPRWGLNLYRREAAMRPPRRKSGRRLKRAIPAPCPPGWLESLGMRSPANGSRPKEKRQSKSRAQWRAARICGSLDSTEASYINDNR